MYARTAAIDPAKNAYALRAHTRAYPEEAVEVVLTQVADLLLHGQLGDAHADLGSDLFVVREQPERQLQVQKVEFLRGLRSLSENGVRSLTASGAVGVVFTTAHGSST